MKALNSRMILGILGSGQLARMTALAASNLGIETRIYCPESKTSPAEQVASQTFKGSLRDEESILSFCEFCTVVTLENEFIDPNILELIERKFPNKLFPSSSTFKKIGDKFSEKENFEKAGIKVVPYKKVHSADDLISFTEKYGFPVVLKSAKGGYDGYGNMTIKDVSQVPIALSKLKGELLVEAFIPYEKEIAIMVARNQSGAMVFYPIAHTEQENHICHFVTVPAELSKNIEEEIKDEAKKAMLAIDAVGIYAFEFFLTKNNELYLNESAPRPHNSGHYSIEGCETSQFENHVRSIFNLLLGSTAMKSPFVIMLNLLGTMNGPANLIPVDDFLSIERGHLHLYGKKESRVGRKMGHYTLLGEDKKKMKEVLQKLKEGYQL